MEVATKTGRKQLYVQAQSNTAQLFHSFTAGKAVCTYVNGMDDSRKNSNMLIPQTVHCNNTPAMTTKPSIAQSDSLIGRTSMQGQTSTLSNATSNPPYPPLFSRKGSKRTCALHYEPIVDL